MPSTHRDRRVTHESHGAFAKIAAVGLLTVTAACATNPERALTTTTSEVAVSQAAIALPSGQPNVIAVLERRYRNGVTQEIALSTSSSVPGQNTFYVNAIFDPAMQSENEDLLKARTSTLERATAEMDMRLPGIDMRPSSRTGSNRYGPFAFATGRSDKGDLCLYAWQDIKREKPYFFKANGVTSVRLRVCDANASEKQLLRAMEAYTIRSDFLPGGWSEEHPQVATFEAKAPSPAVESEMNVQGRPAPRRGTVKQMQARPASAPDGLREEKSNSAAPGMKLPASSYPSVPLPPSE